MKHLTDPELNRRITANFELRCQIHDQMMGPARDPLHPAINPLSPQWAELADQYAALAAESETLYAQLLRNEAVHA